MTSNSHDHASLQLGRRDFMVGAAGLTFAFAIGGLTRGALAQTASAKGLEVNPWVTIATDDTVSIMSPATEMGQGSYTSLPLIIAEEMDADWAKVRLINAPPIDAIYGNPGFGGIMYTAGSAAVTGYFKTIRVFGAQVRRVLIENVAAHWAVPIEELSTEPNAVVHAKSGRRIGYGEIAGFGKAPPKAPEIKPEDLKKTNQFRLIGKDVGRIEVPTKVNGTARYSIDIAVPGMAYGAVLRAPVDGSGPETIDDSAARKVPGYIGTVKLPYGVGVLADNTWAAFNAKDALKVAWNRSGKGHGYDSVEVAKRYAAAARDLGSRTADWEKFGDLPAAMARSTTVIEGEYRCDFSYHAQMEPLNAVAAVAPDGQSVEVWAGTQSQTICVEATAKALGIAKERVKLNDMLMGGGFGRRGHRDHEFVVDAVLLSKEAKRPVKVTWTREDDVHNGRLRPMTSHYLRAAFDAEGKFVGLHHRVACEEPLEFMDTVRFEGRGRRPTIALAGTELRTYDIPNRLSEHVRQEIQMRTSPLRGIGNGPNKFAVEAFLDEVAAKRGIDPVAFRLELLKNSPRARKVVERVVEMSDFRRKREGRGLGLAYTDYSGTQLGGVAEISVDRTSGQIRVHDFWVAMDPGIAVQPKNVVAQTEGSLIWGLGLALTERITMKDGAVQESNFYDYSVPRMSDIPNLHVEVISTDNHPTGAGQMGVPLVAPAISNAMFALTGKRLRELPMTPDRVLAALKA